MWTTNLRKQSTRLSRIEAQPLDMVGEAVPAHRFVTLISGQVDETNRFVVGCTYAADTVNFKIGTQGHKMIISASATAQLIFDPVAPTGHDDPLTFPPAQCIGMWIYLSNAANVTNILCDIYGTAALTSDWQQGQTTGFSSGWNLIRFPAYDGLLNNWGTAYRLRVMVLTSAGGGCDATVGHVWAECREKASMLFVADGPYDTFMTSGYLDLSARKIPVTFACDVSPAAMGSGTGINKRATWSQIAAAMADGNGNSCGFHGFETAATSGMTAAQIQRNTTDAQRELARRGYLGGKLWRASWVGNLATNHAAAQSYLVAYATPVATANITMWPPRDRYNIPRITLHGQSPSAIDSIFDELQKTRAVFPCYTHTIDAGGGANITPTEWSYFLGKVDAAMAAGWLEAVTFEQLFYRHGGRIENYGGVSYAVWIDPDGSRQFKALI